MKRQAHIWMAIALVSACSAPAQEAVPGGSFDTPYMSVRHPVGEDWLVQSSSEAGVTFARGNVGDSFIAAVRLFRMGPASTPQEYERVIRDGAAKDVDPNNPDRYELLEQSVKYSTERGYPCVRYRAASKDHLARGASEPQILELDGLYCRHPMDASVGAAILYSHRGLTRHGGLREEAERFIQHAALPGPE